ncbi:hypothetical protein [Mycoplasmopsis cynos]|uniref:hypothetical protein n=1 Tax=Mycoplasmopsis cynos TaxID=171284 RepID=UPI00220DF885|nr:hypothetical protein [Mycoplasmopsis cynos]UWV92408.1 hypothetical protein NWE57_06150 [Mycoplasmopsis cynos]
MFITAKQASTKWKISDRRVRILCAEGKVTGIFIKKEEFEKYQLTPPNLMTVVTKQMKAFYHK